jgi:hypothetical protein
MQLMTDNRTGRGHIQVILVAHLPPSCHDCLGCEVETVEYSSSIESNGSEKLRCGKYDKSSSMFRIYSYHAEMKRESSFVRVPALKRIRRASGGYSL